MTYTVVLEPTVRGYHAMVPVLPGCQAEGLTRHEAIANLRTVLQQRLRQVEITAITVEETAENPWITDAGLLADHPYDSLLYPDQSFPIRGNGLPGRG